MADDEEREKQERAVERWKIKKLIKGLQEARGCVVFPFVSFWYGVHNSIERNPVGMYFDAQA